MTDKSHKIHCWCGQVAYPKQLHYPAGDPECGPAHRPQLPCPNCGQQPHKGPCFPNCTCESPSPLQHRYEGVDSFMICKNCGLDIYFDDQPEEGIIEAGTIIPGDSTYEEEFNAQTDAHMNEVVKQHLNLDAAAFARASAETFKDGLQYIQTKRPGVPCVTENSDGTIDIEIPGGAPAFIAECKRQEDIALDGLEWLEQNFGSMLTNEDKDVLKALKKKGGR